MSTTKMAQLEHTVMELGAEIFRLKTQMATYRDQHGQNVRAMKALRTLLDEKGVITADDFDVAVDLSAMVDEITAQSEMSVGDLALEEFKKNVH